MRKEELIKQVAESTGIAICEVRTVIEAALKETCLLYTSPAQLQVSEKSGKSGNLLMPGQLRTAYLYERDISYAAYSKNGKPSKG